MDLESFDARIASALDKALDAGLEPDELEMLLQQRAQDMRELHEWRRTQDDGEG